MARYKILYWHDIPSQVRAEDEGGRINLQLPPRFQEAIDAAAMKAKAIDDDSYTEGFRWSQQNERAGSAELVAGQLLEELDQNYPEIDWRRTAEQIRQKRE